jgi:hypothetical protein
MYSIINLASWSWVYVWLISLKNEQIVYNYICTVIIVLLTLISSPITACFYRSTYKKRFVAKIEKN